MTDSDDPSTLPQAPAGEAGARPRPTLAELAGAETADDPDDPPLASPDDVLPAMDGPGETEILPVAAPLTSPVAEAARPEPAARWESSLGLPAEAARVGLPSASSILRAESPSAASASSILRAESPSAASASSILRAESPSAASASSILRAESPSAASASSILRAESPSASSVLRAEAPSALLSGSALLRAEPTSAAVSASSVLRADPLTPPVVRSEPPPPPRPDLALPPTVGTEIVPRRRPTSTSVAPPSEPPPPVSGSVWTLATGGPTPGTSSALTGARDPRSRGDEHDTLGVGTPLGRPRASDESITLGVGTPLGRGSARASEHDTLGVGTPLPAASTAPLPAAALPPLSGALPPLGEVFRASAPPRAGATTTGSAAHASPSSPPSSAPARAPASSPPPPTAPARPAWGAAAPPPPSVPTEPDMASTSADDTLGIATPAPRRAAPTPPPRRGSNATIGWVVLASLLGMALGGGCVTCVGALGGQGEQVDGLGGPRVAVVELVGPIMDGAETVRELRRHARASDIRAIVVRIDSPGGAVAPSQEIFDAMRAASVHKPVVVSMGTVAASGGFWAAMAGDWVVASPGSITGSIGVISQMPDLRGLAELLRVDLKTYKSGPYKDAGNGLRAPQPGDEAVHMELISDVYEQFVATIAERRKIEPDAVRRFADGRIFTGRRAHELGLVDQLGGLYDAAQHALVLAEARRAEAAGDAPEAIDDEPTLVYPRRPAPGLLRLLSEEAGAGAASGAGRVMERALDATLRDPRVELR